MTVGIHFSCPQKLINDYNRGCIGLSEIVFWTQISWSDYHQIPITDNWVVCRDGQNFCDSGGKKALAGGHLGRMVFGQSASEASREKQRRAKRAATKFWKNRVAFSKENLHFGGNLLPNRHPMKAVRGRILPMFWTRAPLSNMGQALLVKPATALNSYQTADIFFCWACRGRLHLHMYRHLQHYW